MIVALPGKELAQELIAASREQGAKSPMNSVIELAREGRLTEEHKFRLIGQLWCLERLFYYIYGNWAQGLEINDYPPGVKYMLARQIYDDSTHEMLYSDFLILRGMVPNQAALFHHPYSQFVMDSTLASYAFSLRFLASYTHVIRMAGLNLGSKIIEQTWMEQLAGALTGDQQLKEVFSSQFVENRSHLSMGRRIVEEHVNTPLVVEQCRRTRAIASADYVKFLDDLANFVLGRKPSGKSGRRALLGVE
jgi:hypothetical protein